VADEDDEEHEAADLLHPVDELVTALLGEVLLGDELAGTVALLAHLVLALVGHAVRDVVLGKQK
jgi:hypothetical protein